MRKKCMCQYGSSYIYGSISQNLIKTNFIEIKKLKQIFTYYIIQNNGVQCI